ncbi:MAG: 30S ribosomal protein S12 methylthiotransferase RimO [Candidatus Alcyoniella australis]|nr:30S ribosomal protein S12 methylthiotransferase RimO [Candidatus Alcyoniella australis]
MNIRIVTLGCAKNRVDSEQLAALLADEGFEVWHGEPEPDDPPAQIVIVNTCGFIAEAQLEALQTLEHYARLKGTDHGPQRLVAAGCLSQGYAGLIQSKVPQVDLLIGTSDVARAPQLIREMLEGKARPARLIAALGSHSLDEQLPRMIDHNAIQAYLRLSEGCSNRCAYCVIPNLRGAFRSRPAELIEDEAHALAQAGVVELTLIGQDSAAYGMDLEAGVDLADLLPRLARAAPGCWLRLMYAHPASLLERAQRLLPALAEHALSYIDLPLQHGSDEILAAMGRRINAEQSLDLIQRLRAAIPGLTLRTTMIIGFPGETDRHFEELLTFVQQARFDLLGAFSYSPMSGTRAFDLPGRVPDELVQARLAELLAVAEEAAEPARIERVGSQVEVLIEGPSGLEDYPLIGRSQSQAPEVDGVTYLRGAALEPGTLVLAKLEGFSGSDDFGCL